MNTTTADLNTNMKFIRNSCNCKTSQRRISVTKKVHSKLTERDLEACDKLYEQCLEIRNFEISNLVSRNNFFMIFQGVLIAGVIQASDKAPPIVQFLSCFLGLVLSGLQLMTASGAKFWQEAWEDQLDKAERRLKRIVHSLEGGRYFRLLFSEKVNRTERKVKARLRTSEKNKLDVLIVRRFSVSKAPIYAGMAFSVFWLLMVLYTLKGPLGIFLLSFVVGFPN